MIKSYRIFSVRSQLRQLAVYELVIAAVVAVAGAVKRNVTVLWVITVLNGVVPILAAVMFHSAALLMLMGIYNANAPEQPGGYKYFHSLKNSAEHFRSAIVFANVFSLLSSLYLYTLMQFLFDVHIVVYLMCFSFAAIGFQNLLGHSRSLYLKMFSYVIMGWSIGLYASNIAEENGPIKSEAFLKVFGVISAALYIGGWIWTVARARSAWERGVEK